MTTDRGQILMQIKQIQLSNRQEHTNSKQTNTDRYKQCKHARTENTQLQWATGRDRQIVNKQIQTATDKYKVEVFHIQKYSTNTITNRIGQILKCSSA